MNTDIPYTIRRSTRARRVRVNVHAHTGVEVVLPARASERAAAAAVQELRPWIERRLHEAHATLARIAERGATVPYLGELAGAGCAAGAHARAPPRRGSAGARGRSAAGARALLPPCRARGDRRAAGPRHRAGGHPLQRPLDPRAALALGLVLGEGGDELQLAPVAGARAACSTTSSGTRSATSRSSTTRLASGRSSSAAGRAGARTASGCAGMGRRWCCRALARRSHFGL